MFVNPKLDAYSPRCRILADTECRGRSFLAAAFRRSVHSCDGFTLLEVAIYVAVLTVIGAPLVSLVLTSSRSTSENDTFSRVEERNRTALFRLEKEIRKAISGTATVDNSGKRLIFTPA